MARVFRNLHHLFFKLKIIGHRRFIRAVYCRMRRRIYIAYARKGIVFGAHETMGKTFDFGDGRKPRPLDFLQKVAEDCDREKIITMADEYVAKRFDLLGSGKQSFDRMPWHEDFRLSVQNQNADCLFDSNIFYADIRLPASSGKNLIKDIKVPWELSRFHHLPVLARAYCATGDMRYANAAKQQVVDWLDNNPYRFGVNWICPMEVAIRATNWIVAWQWLREPFCSDETFCKRMIGSLYDHMHYLENNWEFYDGRTSNHYLSNLIGYLYLCYFLDDSRKFDWCYQELLREFDWQIFDEGTSYEGSTRYHQLVTELFLHAFLLVQGTGKKITSSHLDKLNRMIQFVQWCKPNKHCQIVVIGDDDSGSLLHKNVFTFENLISQVSEKQTERVGMKQYEKFGLSIIKTDEWHVTVRHHAYTNRQPSGHFHNDAASMTLAYKGVPILVDPGSYLYTASVYWRNRFRSVNMHNTVCIDTSEPVFLDNRLFALDISQATANYYAKCQKDSFVVSSQHGLYAELGVKREINIQSSRCCITDFVRRTSSQDKKRIMSNFIFARDITLQQHGNSFILLHKQKQILNIAFSDNVTIQRYKAWFSYHYGNKIQTEGLQVIWPSGCDRNQVWFN